MKTYKKFCTRSLPLYAAQYFYEGDTKGLPALTDGVVQFTPLFVKQKGKGVAMYYPKDIVEHGAQASFRFFSENMSVLQTLTELYKQYARTSEVLIEHATIDDIEKLFRINADIIFPITNTLYQLGKQEHFPELQKAALLAKETRYWNDTVIYGPGVAIYELLERKFPGHEEDWGEYIAIQEAILGDIPNKGEIERRRKGWVLFEGKLHSGVVDYVAFLRTKNVCIEEDIADPQLREVKGLVARRGKMQGRVRVIHTYADMDAFEEGEIIVSPMTTPDFISIVKKAGAIITDEGGVTCHAAIVAREVAIPCVIGTRFATQVFRTGDMVEVDALLGVARMVE